MSLIRRLCTLLLMSASLMLTGCDAPDRSVAVPPSSTATAGLSLIVHPYDTPSRLVERFQPLCDFLSARLEMPVRLDIARSYVDQMRRITSGQADLSYIGPTPFLRAQNAYLRDTEAKLIPLAAEVMGGKPAYHSVIVARADADINALADLHGKLMAFGASHSYSSHYVPQVMLLKAGVNLSDLKDYAFLNRHERVALAVLHGDFDAGGLRAEMVTEYLHRKPGLKIIATSPPLSPHLIVARAGLPAAQQALIQRSLLAFSDSRHQLGGRPVHYRAPDPIDLATVQQVVDIIETRPPPAQWPW